MGFGLSGLYGLEGREIQGLKTPEARLRVFKTGEDGSVGSDVPDLVQFTTLCKKSSDFETSILGLDSVEKPEHL